MPRIQEYVDQNKPCSNPCADCPSKLFIPPTNYFVGMTTAEVLEKHGEEDGITKLEDVYEWVYGTDAFDGEMSFDVNEPIEFDYAARGVLRVAKGECPNYSIK